MAVVLAIVFMYTLAFSHTNAPFSENNEYSKHWWKPRLDVAGWADQHQQYVQEAAAASGSSVCFPSHVALDKCSLHMQKQAF